MRIAVVTEGSTKNRNHEVVEALECFDHTVYNVGMKDIPGEPTLNYLETGIISALLLNIGSVDLVVGGCGTGQGYMNAVLQFPGVACGLLIDPTDAFLFARVNAGNCVSLPLNKGYGNLDGKLRLIDLFAKLFGETFGGGYPTARRDIQIASKDRLEKLSVCAHRSCAEILAAIDAQTLGNALLFPGVIELIRSTQTDDDGEKAQLKKIVLAYYDRLVKERTA